MDESQFHNLAFMVGEGLQKFDKLEERVAALIGLLVPTHEAILQMSAGRRTSARLVESKRVIIEFMVETERVQCPCCFKDAPIIGPDSRLMPGTEFDHWRPGGDNSVTNIWPVHGLCHVKLHSRPQVRDAFRARFESFQMDLAEWMVEQVPYGKVDTSGQVPLFGTLPVWINRK